MEERGREERGREERGREERGREGLEEMEERGRAYD
jgi:hypothetical protein